jgi:enediyne polyketide synthase
MVFKISAYNNSEFQTERQNSKIGNVDNPKIAVVGMGCRYPGAKDIRQLWENILARKRQFRSIPDCRLPLDQYYDPNPTTPDKTHGNRAAVIDGFNFDFVGKRIPKKTFDSTDISQWLALDVALKTIEDGGYTRNSIPNERSGVILGNTLTGEQTRSNMMRLRWPYVRRSLRAAAESKGIAPQLIDELTKTMEEYYKSVFPPTTEDTLAGGLSNTIAGRICNFLNFQGGGYTVDGACSSSLIAIATAANALCNRELDIALAGGVDISLDTFELIGFAKTGALTSSDMTVYDKKASGFIPGEGCGFVLLKRLEDARESGDHVYAVIRGWGISSDGKGGITAPSQEGQALALKRAYEKAGYSPNDIDFIEGHGTGTPVGDRTELGGIALAMDSKGKSKVTTVRSCGITSFKSLVGHTKAAAGIGGLLKAIMAVNRRVLPPTAGCKEPNVAFETFARDIYPILQGETKNPTSNMRAGVSAMGFGGINCHVTLESGDAPSSKLESSSLIEEQSILVSTQKTELFILGATSISKLLKRTKQVINLSKGMSLGELVDLAAHLAHELQPKSLVRASVIASSPKELLQNLDLLEKRLSNSPPSKGEIAVSPEKEFWVSNCVQQSRVGFLFPGQGSQKLNMASTLVKRYDWARELLKKADCSLTKIEKTHEFQEIGQFIFRPLDRSVDANQIKKWSSVLADTKIAQPAICFTSLVWNSWLERLNIKPSVVGGHSLGELTAFHVAGAFDEEALLNFAAVRGKTMSASVQKAGSMLSISCSQDKAEEILSRVKGYAVIANVNSPSQTVISGEKKSIQEVIEIAKTEKIQTHQLQVSNAFHSQLVSSAAEYLHAHAPIPEKLENTDIQLLSSMNGEEINSGINLRKHFADQVLSQVNFINLVKTMAKTCDLIVEVGPGRVLSNLVKEIVGVEGPICLPIESKSGADIDLNNILANLFIRGSEINWDTLYQNRLVHPFVPAQERIFIENPCERPFKTFNVKPFQAVETSQKQSESTNAFSSSPQVVSQMLFSYLSQRGKFLSEVIRADLETLPFSIAPSLPQEEAQGEKIQISNSSFVKKSKQAEKAETSVDFEKAETNIEEFLLELVEERTGFPKDTLSMDLHLLDDLNLDSIKAGEYVAEAARRLEIEKELDPSQFANATLGEIAQTLQQLHQAEKAENNIVSSETKVIKSQKNSSNNPKISTIFGRSSWVRDFIIQYKEEAISNSVSKLQDVWKNNNVLILHISEETDMCKALKSELKSLGASVQIASFDDARVQSLIEDDNFSALIAILPRISENQFNSKLLQEMIERLKAVTLSRQIKSLAFVQFGGGYFGTKPQIASIENCCANAFAASLHLERSDVKVQVVDLDAKVSSVTLAKCIINEITTEESYTAVGYDAHLIRRVPRPVVQEFVEYQNRNISWTNDDVILVTGGAKGITAECVLALSKATNLHMALVGRSPYPSTDSESNSNIKIDRILDSYKEAGLNCRYYSCDITDLEAVKTLKKQIQHELGQITGVIHGAGLNQPKPLEQVSVEAAYLEVAPKVLGALNLCEVLKDSPPKLFIAFSSVIGVIGMPGNAWYGFANETLSLILRHFEAQHLNTSVLSIAYSVWDELGMGARMGSVKTLAKMGIDAIPKDEGVRRFLRLFKKDPGEHQVIVSARDSLDTWSPKQNDLPVASRFLEQLRYVEPGVEVISRVHLNLEQDSYVQDHVFNGSYLFPTVFGLEAMAQVVAYATGKTNFQQLRIEDIKLKRPIVVDPDRGIDIEVYAEVLEKGSLGTEYRVIAGIKTERTGFVVDHFSATFVLDINLDSPQEKLEFNRQPLDIQPKTDLYGWLLFQGSRFQRLQKLYTLTSKKCIFSSQIRSSESHKDEVWLLGDPFFRDSLLQSVQPMIPKDICLPVHIDSIEIHSPQVNLFNSCLGVAINENFNEQEYSTSVLAVTENGQLIERLKGYQLKVLEHKEDNPTAEELANQSHRDEQLLLEKLNYQSKIFQVAVPESSLEHLPGLHSVSREERHEKELPVFYKTINKLSE